MSMHKLKDTEAYTDFTEIILPEKVLFTTPLWEKPQNAHRAFIFEIFVTNT